jgi:DNA-binding NtrC family response regulator
MPALRERGTDVVLLARRLLERISTEMGRPGVRLSPAAEHALQEHSWPGNVRQLRNVLERAALLSDRALLEPADIDEPRGPTPVPAGSFSRLSLEEAERRHIEAVLREQRGGVAAAAEILGLSRSALYERIKKHGLVTAKRSDS